MTTFVAEFEGNDPKLEAHMDVPNRGSGREHVYLAMAGGAPHVPYAIRDRVFGASIPNEIHVVVPAFQGVTLSGFRDVMNLTRVTFGASSRIEYFDEDCFARSGIVEIFVPDSVKEIGPRCFADCWALRRVLFSPFSNLEYIGDEAFSRLSYSNESEMWCISGCNLETLYMPDSLSGIGDRAFEECSLEDIVFSPTSKLGVIGEMCFAGTGGGRCTLPAGVDICCGAFNDSNINVTFSGDDFYTFGHLLLKDHGKLCVSVLYGLGDVVVPDFVEVLGPRCFSRVLSLKRVTFGESSRLEVIGEEAFAFGGPSFTASDHVSDQYDGCGITEICIPDSVREIGDRCFAGCNELASVTFGTSSRLERIGDGAFADLVFECSHEYVDRSCRFEEIVIPDSVETIGEKCFFGCCYLRNIVVGPESRLKKVGREAFKHTEIPEEVIDSVMSRVA